MNGALGKNQRLQGGFIDLPPLKRDHFNQPSIFRFSEDMLVFRGVSVSGNKSRSLLLSLSLGQGDDLSILNADEA